MKKTVIKLTESDLHNIIKKVILKEFIQPGFSLAKLNTMHDIGDKHEYCYQYLGEPLNPGGSRVVFEIGDGEVLKLALEDNLECGISQNRMEYNNYLITSKNRKELNALFPKVYQIAKDETWITCERVLPIQDYDFEAILGMPYYDNAEVGIPGEYDKYKAKQNQQNLSVVGFIEWGENPSFYDDESYEEYKELSIKHPWFSLLYEYIRRGDYLTDLLMDNFGVAIRNNKPTVVILDSGWDDMS